MKKINFVFYIASFIAIIVHGETNTIVDICFTHSTTNSFPLALDDMTKPSLGIMLVATTEKNSFTNGEPVIVTLELTNESDEEAKYIAASIAKTFPAKVFFSGKTEVPLTPYGRDCANGLDGYFTARITSVTKEYPVSYKFEINKLHEMTKNGKYTISFTTKIEFGTPSKDVAVKSNTIEITIVEDDYQPKPKVGTNIVEIENNSNSSIGVILTTSVERTVFTNGEPIDITLTLQNMSDEDAEFLSASIVETFPAKVYRSNNIVVPLTPYGKDCEDGFDGCFNRRISYAIKDNPESYDFDICELYDMTQNGKYTIYYTIKIKYGTPSKDVTVKSNTIEITIVEGDYQPKQKRGTNIDEIEDNSNSSIELSLTTSVEKTVFTNGEPINITLTLQNMSDEDAEFLS